jgi:hypothetical protein
MDALCQEICDIAEKTRINRSQNRRGKIAIQRKAKYRSKLLKHQISSISHDDFCKHLEALGYIIVK